jgi:hypothetical protein
MDSIREFSNFIQSWRSFTIAITFIGVKGIKDSKGEKKLLIIDEKEEFDQNVFALGSNFKTEYEQLLEAYNGGHCAMVLLKFVITTTKENQYLKGQRYKILTKVVDETIQTHHL